MSSLNGSRTKSDSEPHSRDIEIYHLIVFCASTVHLSTFSIKQQVLEGTIELWLEQPPKGPKTQNSSRIASHELKFQGEDKHS
jgi:hypothetical protein